MIERRKYKRSKTNLPVKIADLEFDVITETYDISPSGAYCKVSRFLPVMSKVNIVLLVPFGNEYGHTKKIRCKGVVVRMEPTLVDNSERPHYNIAIFFTNISRHDQKVLEDYINSPCREGTELQISQETS